ncbi:MAG TPA: 2-hydroxyacyl-CoA dehydratase [Thermoanaerobacterales bacterium]|jgi:benzoyl-CoA reductase/2-hydroxyglutaryl-CoA dehydratase subunit BcrC/BadD/HgdB|nr:2-hydroxyacyl-CoA dehydratase [Thermoanaerobacterales bacterium]
MKAVEIYCNFVRKNLDNPRFAKKLINLGIGAAEKYVSYFADRRFPPSHRYLNKICMKYMREPLFNPERSVWVNMFTPTEIFHSMGVFPLFIETYSSYMSGFFIEDALIDKAEAAGISNTLCSFHKAFIGAGEYGILQKPKMAITTSMICDGNLNTFRYLAKKYDIPFYIIDVPSKNSENTVEYVKNQLAEIIQMSEEVFSQKFDIDKLREIVKIENKTNEYRRKYLSCLSAKVPHSVMSFEMFMLFTSHVFMGRPETLKFYQKLFQDIKNAPERTKKGIFFIHLLPMWEPSFQQYFNLNEKYDILGCDLNYDFIGKIGTSDPLKGIAEKLITIPYNGDFEKIADHVTGIIDMVKPDGIIQFCHWGCKQSIGIANLYKKIFKEKDIPFLTVDGDIMDKRNNQKGQIKTRLEAFLEILESR